MISAREEHRDAGPQPNHGWQGRPDPPRGVQLFSGSLEVRITWYTPANLRGVDGFRVYHHTENEMVFETRDNKVRQYVSSSVQSDVNTAFYVSCISAAGKESTKVQVIGKPNTDQLVVTGTTGATAGTSTNPPPGWGDEPSGGGGHGPGKQ